MIVFCVILIIVCMGELFYILHIRRQLGEWLCFLKGWHKTPERKSFVKGNTILADINFELNRILEESRRQLMKLQRAEQANQQLLTDLSHDVRTPLASLTGYLESLDSHNAPKPEEYIHVAYRKALDLQALVDLLFQWFKLSSKEQRYQIKDYDINELTRQAIIEQIPILERSRILLSTDIPEDEWFVQADQTAYARMINNLLNNAVKHGKCSLIEVAVKKGDEKILVFVSNDGVCIPQKELPYIFDRLYKCDSARRESGSGLGLAIVRELAHAIGGEITAQSVPEGMTTFCLTLPLSVRKN